MKLENIKHDLTLPAVKGLNVAALTAAFFLGWSGTLDRYTIQLEKFRG